MVFCLYSKPIFYNFFKFVFLPLPLTEATSLKNSPWWPEHCSDNAYKYKCGDICVWYMYRCYCGGDDWNWFDKGDKYCCVPPGDSQCTKDSDHELYYNCSSGVLLPLYQPCHDNNCAGSPVIKVNNCQYDCLARSDEVSVKQNETIIDLHEELKNCTTDFWNDPGLNGTITNGACKPNYKWCTEDISCHSDVSRDTLQLQRFCQNSTFLESQDCHKYSSGAVSSYGERCRGSQKHCIYPSYLQSSYKTYRDGGHLPQCKDKSDKIFERHSQCNMNAQVDIWCGKCQDKRSSTYWWKNKVKGDCETKCEDKSKLIQELRDPKKYSWYSDQDRNDILDPHNCQASFFKP